MEKNLKRLKEIHQDFSSGLTAETAVEVFYFTSFVKHMNPDAVFELKNKIDWYYEQYLQMLNADKTNFQRWIMEEIERQMDLENHHKEE